MTAQEQQRLTMELKEQKTRIENLELLVVAQATLIEEALPDFYGKGIKDCIEEFFYSAVSFGNFGEGTLPVSKGNIFKHKLNG